MSKTTKDFSEYIRRQLEADADLAELVEEEGFHARIAEQVYEARKAAGLSQRQLAERVGTQQSVISRIEDSDYDGHSLALLKRIARALGQNLSVEFYPKNHIKKKTQKVRSSKSD